MDIAGRGDYPHAALRSVAPSPVIVAVLINRSYLAPTVSWGCFL